jgi:hypothetical protein
MRSSLSNTASSKKVYTVNDKNKKKNSAIENPMLQVYDIFTAKTKGPKQDSQNRLRSPILGI